MDDIAIGIDLGTTNSCAAYYINGHLQVLENNLGDRITPSFVYYGDGNELIVGKYAKRMAAIKPDQGVYEIKRLLGRKFDNFYVQNNIKYFSFKVINEGNEPVILIEHQNEPIKKTPEQVCTAILTKIKNDVEKKLGKTITKVVITVPAYFNISQREATLAAATNAGFTVLQLLNEPTAAALTYYLDSKCNDGNYSLVYDLGGGTFDVAILKRCSSSIDIIGVEGDTNLGGKDFDNLIIDFVCKELMKKYSYNPMNERRNMRRLRSICEEAKKALSVMEETDIFLGMFVNSLNNVNIKLTRKQFEIIADKHFKKTIDIVENCLSSCNLKKSAIKEVILSGGSTRIPKIQQMLSEYFNGKKLNNHNHLDECVAEGAALRAAMLSGNPEQEIKGIHIKDVIPLSLGYKNFVDVMNFCIEKNTPIPASQSIDTMTVLNNQKSMTFEIYEGERLNARKNLLLGKMTISDLTPAPPGQLVVILTMSVDKNGILTVTAKEKFRDNIKELKVVYNRGYRSESEVKNALTDAKKQEAEDRQFERFANQKKYLLKYCIQAVYNMENKGLVKTYEDVYKFCQKAKKEVEDMEVDDSEKLNLLTKTVEEKCDSIMQKHDFKFMPILYV